MKTRLSGVRLAVFRDVAGIPQRAAGEQTGLTQNAIYKYEHGGDCKRGPSGLIAQWSGKFVDSDHWDVPVEDSEDLRKALRAELKASPVANAAAEMAAARWAKACGEVDAA